MTAMVMCDAAAQRSEPGAAAIDRRATGVPGRAALMGLGTLAVALGCLVYVVDRDPARSAGLPQGLPLLALGLFGQVGGWLPSFVHAFAFSLFSACVLPARTRPAYGVCAAWAMVDALFELGQHQAIRGPLTGGIAAALGSSHAVTTINRYFLQGSFDLHDLAAGVAGAAVAALVLTPSRSIGQSHDD